MSARHTEDLNEDIDISQLTAADVAEIAARLERDDYATPFDSLRDWHTLRSLAFNRPELVESYMHLLDMEAFDEC